MGRAVIGQVRSVPNFLIVGAMKAGTTSLFAWLGEQPEVFVPDVKEPDYFSRDHSWRRGESWYRGLFTGANHDQMVGEASVDSTHPGRATRAASRIASFAPDARIVFVARDPLERIRSQYRHEVLRGRERRPFADALRDGTSAYVERSLYFGCLLPYIERFPREQICIVRFEDLFGASDDEWHHVLSFLGLPARPRPSEHRNASDGKPQFTPAMRLLWGSRLRRIPVGTPALLRRAAKRLLIRRHPDPLIATADEPVDEGVASAVWDDAERLGRWMGRAEPLWEPTTTPSYATRSATGVPEE